MTLQIKPNKETQIPKAAQQLLCLTSWQIIQDPARWAPSSYKQVKGPIYKG